MKAAIMQMNGKVLVQNVGAATSHDAKIGENLVSGDKIETKDDGLVEIKLDNDNVINLKPKSTLTMVLLTSDPASGTYVNKFQTSSAKLRAIVEKMSSKSTFEIATPTAVAAVRGTIVYLATDGSTTDCAFFDGVGYVTNPVSGKSETVGDGESAQSDSNGNLSAPEGVSDDQYNDMTGGWQPGGETPPGADNQTNQPNEPQRPEGSNFR